MFCMIFYETILMFTVCVWTESIHVFAETKSFQIFVRCQSLDTLSLALYTSYL